jgi:hypothetical protein
VTPVIYWRPAFTQTLLENSGGNTTSSQVTYANLTGTVTYEYVVPVPEPTTMVAGALMFLPFLHALKRKASS